jgi:outer membrane protein OmpA-like peptidoglycan-associated protein
VLFGSNSTTLSSTAKADLGKVAAFVKTSRTAFVVIQGHSDSKGSAAAKERTAMARAHVVQDYLIDLGVPRAQLSHTSLSDTAPAASAAADSAENRRVDVLVKDVG